LKKEAHQQLGELDALQLYAANLHKFLQRASSSAIYLFIQLLTGLD